MRVLIPLPIFWGRIANRNDGENLDLVGDTQQMVHLLQAPEAYPEGVTNCSGREPTG